MFGLSGVGAHEAFCAYLDSLENKIENLIAHDNSPEMSIYMKLKIRIQEKLSKADLKKGELNIELTPEETKLIVCYRESGLSTWVADWSQKYGKLLHAELMSSLFSCRLVPNCTQIMHQNNPMPQGAILMLSWNDPKEIFNVYVQAVYLMEDIVKANYM